jgi:DNA-binding NtrC family response regulator
MKLLKQTLSRYKLIEATAADEALRPFADRSHHVDLLIGDVTLPTDSGLRVAFFLRSAVRNLPVILTFGYPVSSWSVREEDAAKYALIAHIESHHYEDG